MALLSPEDMVLKAKIKLYIEQPFYGALLAQLPIRPCSDTEKPNCPTGYTDGRQIVYNPEWVGTLTIEQVKWFLAHEVLHPALGHLWRRGYRDPEKSNIAMDEAINFLLAQENSPPMQQPPDTLRDPQWDNMAWEAIYEKLPVKTKKQGWGDHSHWGQPGPDDDGQDDPNNNGQSQANEWKQKVADAANQAQQMGKIPAGLERLIGELLRPTLPLANVLMQFLTDDKQDYSMVPPDRRFAAEDLFLPDLFSEETLKDLVICMDTSGSMSEESLRKDLSEIQGLMRTFPEIEGHLFVGDAAVQHVGDLSRLPSKKELKGGGGTDFRPFFKEVVERKLNPVCLCFFTDGYGAYPEKQPDYPVIWILSSDYTVPWGMSLKYTQKG